eukprot:c4642_g1_i2.p1 GENE.c4642_g1_i2~~c4642_g1_i2.p1  ORF type:complete len:517 (+),score=141.75 c4642_g1_i2:61-1551(+)
MDRHLSHSDPVLAQLVEQGDQKQLKLYFRNNNKDPIWCRYVWLYASKSLRTIDSAQKNWDQARQETFGEMLDGGHGIHEHESKVPTFGADMELVLRLVAGMPNPEDTKKSLLMQLCVLHNEFPEVEWCPQLPAFVCLLLDVVDCHEAYHIVSHVIKQDKHLQPSFHFTLTRSRWNAVLLSSVATALERLPAIRKHFDLLNVQVDHLAPLLKNMFLNFLPVEFMSGALTPFLYEGNKILIRYLIATLQFYSDTLLKLKSCSEVCVLLTSPQPLSPTRQIFIKGAFGVRNLSKADLARRMGRVKGNTRIAATSLTTNNHFYVPKFTNNTRSSILSDTQLFQLWQWVPDAHLRRSNAKLVFSTEANGYSLRMFYKMCAKDSPTVLVVQDTSKRVFGGFVTAAWSLDTRVAGTSDCFLFSFALDQPAAFRVTGDNEIFQLTAPHSLQMGGGGDGPGLSIDGDMHEGSSNWCETFDNDPLVSSESGSFQISRLEVWGFAPL